MRRPRMLYSRTNINSKTPMTMKPLYPCLGALIGDTVGSVYEFDNIKTTEFQPLFDKRAEYTDDSIMTIAVADWLVNTGRFAWR